MDDTCDLLLIIDFWIFWTHSDPISLIFFSQLFCRVNQRHFIIFSNCFYSTRKIICILTEHSNKMEQTVCISWIWIFRSFSRECLGHMKENRVLSSPSVTFLCQHFHQQQNSQTGKIVSYFMHFQSRKMVSFFLPKF